MTFGVPYTGQWYMTRFFERNPRVACGYAIAILVLVIIITTIEYLTKKN